MNQLPRIVSLLPAATEIAHALGLMPHVVGVSHECDFPEEANHRPRVTRCPIHNAGLSSAEIDAWVKKTLHETGTLYTLDEPLLRDLEPTVILTQKLCDVCAVGYGSVAKFAGTLPSKPQVVNLEPSCLAEIYGDIRRVAVACDVTECGEEVIADLQARVENVRLRAADATTRPRCFLMEWVEPVFCSGHWGPELVELAGGVDPLGRKGTPSVRVEWQQVLDAAPDVLVLALCGFDVPRALQDYALLREFPGFETLPAVRNNQIYVVNANLFFARPGPHIVDSLELLAGALHPELFPEFASASYDDDRIARLETTSRLVARDVA